MKFVTFYISNKAFSEKVTLKNPFTRLCQENAHYEIRFHENPMNDYNEQVGTKFEQAYKGQTPWLYLYPLKHFFHRGQENNL